MTYPQVFEALRQGLHHLYDPNYLQGSSAATQPSAVPMPSVMPMASRLSRDYFQVWSEDGAIIYTTVGQRMAGVMPPVSHRAITHFDEDVAESLGLSSGVFTLSTLSWPDSA